MLGIELIQPSAKTGGMTVQVGGPGIGTGRAEALPHSHPIEKAMLRT